MTAEYVAYHAAERPEAVAVVSVMRLPQPPRNASGKIRRDELRTMMIELARHSRPVASG